jgi:hypothetical protein
MLHYSIVSCYSGKRADAEFYIFMLNEVELQVTQMWAAR